MFDFCQVRFCCSTR